MKNRRFSKPQFSTIFEEIHEIWLQAQNVYILSKSINWGLRCISCVLRRKSRSKGQLSWNDSPTAMDISPLYRPDGGKSQNIDQIAEIDEIWPRDMQKYTQISDPSCGTISISTHHIIIISSSHFTQWYHDFSSMRLQWASLSSMTHLNFTQPATQYANWANYIKLSIQIKNMQSNKKCEF